LINAVEGARLEVETLQKEKRTLQATAGKLMIEKDNSEQICDELKIELERLQLKIELERLQGASDRGSRSPSGSPDNMRSPTIVASPPPRSMSAYRSNSPFNPLGVDSIQSMIPEESIPRLLYEEHKQLKETNVELSEERNVLVD